MKVCLQPEALDDLRGIAAYIGRHDPRRAATHANRLEAKIAQLGSMGASFRILPHYAASGLRRRIVGAYQIFYLVDDLLRAVLVVRVLHSARDTAQLLRAFE
jgi:plasmid stabilization system protein ParE